jgi:hypothetical protein
MINLVENQSPCLISDVRTCQAAKQTEQVFIIGSANDEFKDETDAILEVLDGFGFTGYFALLSEKSKGLDAFCDKICSKIQASQFCIAMLNDPISTECAELRVPSANVYYEFGMAVALKKQVIPIICSSLRLPFDVQHLDAIVYDNLDDLKGKLKKTIAETLRKTPRKKSTTNGNQEMVKQVYGPLYNEIDRFLSRRDVFTIFNRSEYGTILTSYKWLLDTVPVSLRRAIAKFYEDLDEFNQYLAAAEKIIRAIAHIEARNFTKKYQDAVLQIEIESDTGQVTMPNIEQVLIRKTTPDMWYKAVGSAQKAIRVTPKIQANTPIFTTEFVRETDFNKFYSETQKKVEQDPQVLRLRRKARMLFREGKKLREQLSAFCQ